MAQFWRQIGLVGLGAGLCSALLLASVLSGSTLSVALVYISPLPILIASLGWSHWAGLAAVVTATVALAVAFDPYLLLIFPACIGLPAWWLGYLALLARPAGPQGELDWYPVGRLVLWAAAIGALLVMLALTQLGGNGASIHDTLRAGFDRLLRMQMDPPADGPPTLPGMNDPRGMIDLMVIVLPPAVAALVTLVQLLNLWLAARIVNISGRLRRPWPDLAGTRLPTAAAAVLAATLAASFLPGLVGMFAALPTAGLLIAYAVAGCALMHFVTRRLENRTIVLLGIYATFVLFAWSGWPVVVLTSLGLADAAFDFRRRVAAAREPPVPPA
jgi:hypothetical protein